MKIRIENINTKPVATGGISKAKLESMGYFNTLSLLDANEYTRASSLVKIGKMSKTPSVYYGSYLKTSMASMSTGKMIDCVVWVNFNIFNEPVKTLINIVKSLYGSAFDCSSDCFIKIYGLAMVA